MKRWLLDPTTGEEFLVFLVGQSKYRDVGFIKVFVAFLEDVVADKEVASKAIRLLLYMISKLDWNSLEAWIDPKEAMQDLKISRRTFYEWLKVLQERGYIEKLRPNRYRFRPNVAIKGCMAKVEEVDF